MDDLQRLRAKATANNDQEIAALADFINDALSACPVSMFRFIVTLDRFDGPALRAMSDEELFVVFQFAQIGRHFVLERLDDKWREEQSESDV